MKQAKLFTDGGARGNPGPSGIGGVIITPDNKQKEFSEYIGRATNNQAEYLALITGLNMSIEHNIKHLNCYLDSELIVKQLNGIYRVKNKNIKDYYLQVQDLIQSFEKITFKHVPRDKNKQADKLVNKAIDEHG